MTEETTLIEFPCDFSVKIMGKNSATFLDDIRDVALKHFPSIEQEKITFNLSESSNYIAITVTVFAENKKMLDAFYEDLVKHPDIQMVL